ncbi:MAG: cyclic pyranopterin monophosphate synthase MoaC [Brachymonas sp.]|jgi:cyclic pyranopterin phosphate synthase
MSSSRDSSSTFNHFDAQGQAWMVDVGHKPHSQRRARACGHISLQAATIEKIRAGSMGKGDVLGIARIAGIMASKRCSELIPLCHPIALSHASVEFQLDATGVSVLATCATTGPTGVEMEALSACSASLLTIYDMCKAIDKSMEIGGIRLLEKTGGSSSSSAAA